VPGRGHRHHQLNRQSLEAMALLKESLKPLGFLQPNILAIILSEREGLIIQNKRTKKFVQER
jgi:hypothetical protein